MSMDFSEYLDVLEGQDFDETPVDLETFCYDAKYLGLLPLSDLQIVMLKAMTQVYKKETLIELYGEEKGLERSKQTYREVILQLGKGSGKDYTSTIACAYIVYQLLCLKDPAGYYGKPAGDAIDILNIAINATQAKNVFFKGFRERIRRSPWFQGKYDATQESMKFDKGITVHSGHSEREAWEGYNTLVVILDEISGFAVENNTGHTQSKTAEDIYKMYNGSLSSRFPDYGKLLLLSFPRYKNDFIQKRYDEVVAQKEVVIRSADLVVNPDLPEDFPGNTINVEWEEDHIISYREARVFALKRPTWEVNPTRSLHEYTQDFYKDMQDALSRFACMPPDSIDAFFKSRTKIETAFNQTSWAISEDGVIADWFKPIDEKQYYIHVDLAQKIDRCALSLAHVEEWVLVSIGTNYKEYQPKIVVDAIRWWTPSSTEAVNFSEVREFILDLFRLGFNIKMVTFDRWNSKGMMDELAAYGIKTELLSVGKKHYQDLSLILTEERLTGPANEILIEELLQLRVIRDRVDHPRKGSKDLSDAVTGAVYNAIARTPKEINKTIEVHTYDMLRDERKPSKVKPGGSINPPKRPPQDLEDFLADIEVI